MNITGADICWELKYKEEWGIEMGWMRLWAVSVQRRALIELAFEQT